MPTKIKKQFPSLIVDFLNKNIYHCLTGSTFLYDFKKAAFYPTHQPLKNI